MSAGAVADEAELPCLPSDGPDSAREHAEAGGAGPKGAAVALFSVASACICAAVAAPTGLGGGHLSDLHDPSGVDHPSMSGQIWDEYAGVGSLLLYGAQQAPCDVDELRASLEDGMGYFLDRGVPGVMCGNISAGNACRLWVEHGPGGWSRNASGTTYLPSMKIYDGWGPDLDSQETAPCDERNFKASLGFGMGYFFDRGVEGGLCKSISAKDVLRLWNVQLTGAWTKSATGKTYLPYCTVDTTDHHANGKRQPWQVGLTIALLCAYLALIAYNIYTSRHHGGHQKGKGQSTLRCNVWDAIKFVLMTGVIFFHCAFYLSAEDLRSWTVHRAVLRPVVPCFVFVSGVFGADVSPRALWKAALYPWPCVLVIGGVLAARCIGGRLSAATADFNGFAFWYLWCLCFWRLTVSPVVRLGSRMAGGPIALLILALQLLAGALLRLTGPFDGPWSDVWRCFLFYAPVFAAGQLLAPTSWRDALSAKPRLRGAAAASAAFVVLWYLLLATSPGFRRWNTAYCADEETCNIFNYGVPEDALSGPFGLASLCKGVATLALRLGIVLAFLGLLGAGLCELEAVCPSAVSCAAGWGERSLFAYVLHHVWLELARAAGGREALDAAPASCFPALCFALALQATVVLSSEGTAKLARWVLVPPWL